ncbi:MAG TPA: hypothetical protein VFC78_23420 [Tepidisphaeraceae bacterium]|nr:hypothetical protein [Tepidisphaeraceae bacterium]
MLRLKATLLVAVSVLLCATGTFGADREPDSKAIVQSYRVFFPKFIAAWGKIEWKHPEDVKVSAIKYDVKKTDSLVNPIIGILAFKSATDAKGFDEAEFTFSFEDGKWTVLTYRFQFQIVGAQRRPLAEEDPPPRDSQKAADEANATANNKKR